MTQGRRGKGNEEAPPCPAVKQFPKPCQKHGKMACFWNVTVKHLFHGLGDGRGGDLGDLKRGCSSQAPALCSPEAQGSTV